MTAIEPIVSATGRYNLKETAQILGVHTSTICNYVNDKKIVRYNRKSNNRPYFLGSDILKCWQSHY